jgi:FkbM family methyltransferase
LLIDPIAIAKRLTPSGLKKQLKDHLGVPSVESSLANMRRNGFLPHRVIDVGAYHGDWTRMVKRQFPEAAVLMVEPQLSLQEHLTSVASEFRDLTIAPVLLGATEKSTVTFHHVDSASSVLAESQSDARYTVDLPMTTLAALTEGTPFCQPDFIKLDVQGYELEVLKGGPRLIESAEAVLLEVNLIEINTGAPLFSEVTRFMVERNLRLYDVCTFIRRPYDMALWQVDAIFVKDTSPLVESRRWA